MALAAFTSKVSTAMLRSSFTLFVCTALASLLLVACPLVLSESGSSGQTVASGGTNPVADVRGAFVTFDGAIHATYPDISRVAALPGGDVVLATLDFNVRVLLARLDPENQVVWTSGFIANGGVCDALVNDGTIVVVANHTATAVRVGRFDFDGALRDVREVDGIGSCARLVGLADGGFLLAGGANVARLDPEFRVIWSKTIAGAAAMELEGDFVFAGTPLRLAPAHATGIEVVRTSRDGVVRWQSFVTPGPGRHSIAGLGLVGDDLVVACGNEVADSRSTASLSPLVVSRFDPKTGTHRGTRRADVALKLPDGTTGSSLAFGSGLNVAVKDGVLHVGAILNAGGPEGARTSTVGRLEGDTFYGRDIGGAFTITEDGDLVGVNLTDLGPAITRVGGLEANGACARHVEGVLSPIEVISIVDAGGLEPGAVKDATLVADAVAVRLPAKRTERCAD